METVAELGRRARTAARTLSCAGTALKNTHPGGHRRLIGGCHVRHPHRQPRGCGGRPGRGNDHYPASIG